MTPDEVGGLILWLKADAIAGLNDGDPVGTWEDQSDQGNDAVEATNKPIYKVDIINSLPVVRFDGVNDLLTAPLSGLTNHTVFIVFAKDHATHGPCFQQRNAGFYQFCAGFYNYQYLGTGSSWLEKITTFVDQTWYYACCFWDTNITRLYKDGELNDSRAVNNMSTTTFSIAKRLDYGAFFKGDIAEIFVFDNAISDADRAAMDAYLEDKYFYVPPPPPPPVPGVACFTPKKSAPTGYNCFIQQYVINRFRSCVPWKLSDGTLWW